MVESLNLLNDELDVTEYEAVIAATGKISKAVYPDIPGLTENFTGKYMHGSDYVNNSDLEGKFRVGIQLTIYIEVLQIFQV